MANNETVNPLNVELCAVLERALNFIHSGNMKVITPTTMNKLWIGQSLIQDGLPCLNPHLIRFVGSSSWEVLGEQWPWSPISGMPMSSAQCVVEHNYGVLVSNVSYSNNILVLWSAATISVPPFIYVRSADYIDTSLNVSILSIQSANRTCMNGGMGSGNIRDIMDSDHLHLLTNNFSRDILLIWP